jgi:hypothetical protein
MVEIITNFLQIAGNFKRIQEIIKDSSAVLLIFFYIKCFVIHNFLG